jgi:hypothetical protein
VIRVDSERHRTVFIAHIDDSAPITLREGRGMGYFKKEEIAVLAMPVHIRNILETYFVHSGSRRK